MWALIMVFHFSNKDTQNRPPGKIRMNGSLHAESKTTTTSAHIARTGASRF